MIKKIYIRKIAIATLTLFVLFLLYLMPEVEEKEIVLNNDTIEYIENEVGVIYLLDSQDYIARTNIITCNCDTVSKAKDLTESLIIDGNKSNIIPNGFRSIIPSGTTVLDLSLDQEVLTINFSKELLDINEQYEEKMIEAITYTLTSIPGIDKVIIQVEGTTLTNLPQSNKILPTSLDKSYGINKKYELTSTKNIDSYTVYYLDNYNDNCYYVPVTKYVNQVNEDKVKIIIDELSSQSTIDSNLMSLLNVNTQLIDYQLDDNHINLNFNNMILSGIAENTILEEVIYTISLSLADNYDIEAVSFSVENEKISEIYVKDID